MKSASADGRDDSTLVAAAQAGDGAALEALLVRHHDRLHAVCRRLTGNDADAADASQEAIIAIPPGTVRSRIARGRAALVPLLGHLGNPSDEPDRPTPYP